MLHDVLEDCGPQHAAAIRDQFGERGHPSSSRQPSVPEGGHRAELTLKSGPSRP
jgi:hypothetical protein